MSESTTTALYRLFAAGWKAGHSPSLEDALKAVLPAYRATLFPRLFQVEIYYRRLRGEVISLDDYLDTFPEYAEEIRALGARHTDSLPLSGGSTMTLLCTSNNDADLFTIADEEEEELYRVGRYELQRMVGVGGFAVVWQARDPSLDRPVAIKVPRSDRRAPASCSEMLEEARRISRLNLSGVVPVLDIVDDGTRCFIVSHFMEGGTLAARLQKKRFTPEEACDLVAAVAETLQRAHVKGILHRDIKPSNILLDEFGKPWVSDFGLATTEAEQWKDCGAVLGTVAYMSPEQARGEGHLVDGRTDVYSLGMVLYELLTGRVAFLGKKTQADIVEQILKRSPRPLRSLDESVPEELERICLKCLAKDVSARYATAGDLAKELRAWLAQRNAAPLAAPARRRGRGFAVGVLLALSLLVAVAALPWILATGSRARSASTSGSSRTKNSCGAISSASNRRN